MHFIEGVWWKILESSHRRSRRPTKEEDFQNLLIEDAASCLTSLRDFGARRDLISLFS